MTEDDPRHGTNAGYIAHTFARTAPCAACKDAHATYKRNRRARRYFARGPLMIDGTGTRRRLRALAALGWSLCIVDERMGHSPGVASRFITQNGPVRRSTAAKYAQLYDELSMNCPTGPYADRARRMAQRKGWLPPLAWDDDKIDDPVHNPHEPVHDLTLSEIDEVVVGRVLSGERLPTRRAEREEILRRWVAKGGSERSLCNRMGWKQGRYAQAPVDDALGVVGRKPHPRSVTVQREAS